MVLCLSLLISRFTTVCRGSVELGWNESRRYWPDLSPAMDLTRMSITAFVPVRPWYNQSLFFFHAIVNSIHRNSVLVWRWHWSSYLLGWPILNLLDVNTLMQHLCFSTESPMQRSRFHNEGDSHNELWKSMFLFHWYC